MGDLSLEKFPILDADPRAALDDEEFDRASRNGFPIVAGDAVRRDRGGLAIGAAIALALGALTFAGLSHGGKERDEQTTAPSQAPQPPPQALTVIDQPTPRPPHPTLPPQSRPPPPCWLRRPPSRRCSPRPRR